MLTLNVISIVRQTTRDIIEILELGRIAFLKEQWLRRHIYSVKGPNHIWHMDGNDKLKPYGFAIHSCMDGYSRKILWLEVSISNKDPSVIFRYYFNTTINAGPIPAILRCDRGTENFITGDMQMLLRGNHDDCLTSVAMTLYGKSSHNQRSESV